MTKSEVISQLRVTVNLGKDYLIICNLKDSKNKVWECTFPRMSLLSLITAVDHLFTSKILKAKIIKFTFKNSQIIVKKSTYEGQKDDIICQIVD